MTKSLITRPGMRARILLGAGALLTAILGIWFVARPAARERFFDPYALAPITLTPAPVSGLVLIVTGVLGLAAALALISNRSRRFVIAVAIAETLVYLLVLCGSTLVMLLGYLLAGLVPIGVVVVLALACRRFVVMRYLTVLIVALVGLWGYLTQTLAPSGILHLLSQIAQALVDQRSTILTMLSCVALATGWALLVRGMSHRTPALITAAAFVRRHRRLFTYVAAACPLPYVLMRLTWLTPWQQFTPTDMTSELRLWGLLLGGAAVLGGVLTLGLIRQWGVTFPRWIPRLAGQSVPTKLGVIPGLTVAAIMTSAAAPMIMMAARDEMPAHAALVLTLVVFPFWLWGPSLALAVWGYAADRQARLTADAQRVPVA